MKLLGLNPRESTGRAQSDIHPILRMQHDRRDLLRNAFSNFIPHSACKSPGRLFDGIATCSFGENQVPQAATHKLSSCQGVCLFLAGHQLFWGCKETPTGTPKNHGGPGLTPKVRRFRAAVVVGSAKGRRSSSGRCPGARSSPGLGKAPSSEIRLVEKGQPRNDLKGNTKPQEAENFGWVRSENSGMTQGRKKRSGTADFVAG